MVKGATNFSDFQDVLAALETAFGNPDLLRHALNDLHSLHQGPDEDYSTFIAEFERWPWKLM